MTNYFAKDFAATLKCSAAEECLSQLLCGALTDTTDATPNTIAVHAPMEMRDAEKYKTLRLKTCREDWDGIVPNSHY